MEFIGKFHPLLIHLPIGFLLASFGLELLFLKNGNEIARKSIHFLLGLGAAAAILSAIIGYMLSLNGGYDNQLLTIHQWSGISVAVIALTFYVIKNNIQQKTVLWSGWGSILILITVTGHYGGSLTHGKTYLIESAPEYIKSYFAAEKSNSLNKPLDSVIVFTDIIQPIINQKCVDCHGESKTQGRLNLQTIAGWKKGGKNGNLVVGGDPIESLILQRIYLPTSDKKHMPPSGKTQLDASELAILEWWISENGDYSNKVSTYDKNHRIDQILMPEFAEKNVYTQLTVPTLDEEQILDLQSSGLKILNTARGNSFLEVNFSGDSVILQEHFDLLSKVKKNITRLDFSYSGITNEQLELLKQFPNLVYLSLADTNISDEGMIYFKSLKNLQLLNLHSTNITDASIEHIADIPNLDKVYLWNTKVSGSKLKSLIKSSPRLKVDY